MVSECLVALLSLFVVSFGHSAFMLFCLSDVLCLLLFVRVSAWSCCCRCLCVAVVSVIHGVIDVVLVFIHLIVLLSCSFNRHFEAARLLIDRGADVNATAVCVGVVVDVIDVVVLRLLLPGLTFLLQTHSLSSQLTHLRTRWLARSLILRSCFFVCLMCCVCCCL